MAVAAIIFKSFKPRLSQTIMNTAEIRSQIEEIAKRAGYLWRYL